MENNVKLRIPSSQTARVEYLLSGIEDIVCREKSEKLSTSLAIKCIENDVSP